MKKLELKEYGRHAFVCHGKHCLSAGAPAVRIALVREAKRQGESLRVSRTTCQGQCKQGCVVFVEAPKRRWWGRVKPADAVKLIGKLRGKRGGRGGPGE